MMSALSTSEQGLFTVSSCVLLIAVTDSVYDTAGLRATREM